MYHAYFHKDTAHELRCEQLAIPYSVVVNVPGITGLKERTRYNVIQSCATIVFANHEKKFSPGSKLTENYCKLYNKPWMRLIDDQSPDFIADRIHDWLGDNDRIICWGDVKINFAGSRSFNEKFVADVVYNLVHLFEKDGWNDYDTPSLFIMSGGQEGADIGALIGAKLYYDQHETGILKRGSVGIYRKDDGSCGCERWDYN